VGRSCVVVFVCAGEAKLSLRLVLPVMDSKTFTLRRRRTRTFSILTRCVNEEQKRRVNRKFLNRKLKQLDRLKRKPSQDSFMFQTLSRSFLFSRISRPTEGPNQTPIQWVLSDISPGEKRHRHRVHPSSGDLRIGGSKFPLPIRLHDVQFDKFYYTYNHKSIQLLYYRPESDESWFDSWRWQPSVSPPSPHLLCVHPASDTKCARGLAVVTNRYLQFSLKVKKEGLVTLQEG